MSVRVACPVCEKGFAVLEEHLGKRVRCKNCGEVFEARCVGEEEVVEGVPLEEPRSLEFAVEDEADSRPTGAGGGAMRMRRLPQDPVGDRVPAGVLIVLAVVLAGILVLSLGYVLVLALGAGGAAG